MLPTLWKHVLRRGCILGTRKENLVSAGPVVQFGTFEFDLSSGELRHQGRMVPLQSQPAQVLAKLVANPGEIVSRDDLRRAIWTEDTFVEFDTALNVAVNKIRQALRDSATAPRFVETVPRRGYRFLADVRPAARQPSGSTREPAPPIGRTPAHGRWQPWVAASIAALLAIALWTGSRASPSLDPVRSVAVLPFRPLIVEARDEALEVGLAEAIIVRLGDLRQLRVPSIHTVQRYARQHVDPQRAGRELGADAVLEGNLLRQNGSLRLSARLIEVAGGTTLWAQHWDLPWSDIFTIQDTTAAEVSRALALRLGPEGTSMPPRHPTSAAAYEPYLRARFLLLRRTVGDSQRAAALLEEAVGLDPRSAAAHASLAFAYVSVPLLDGPTDPFVERGRQAAQRALDLDPGNAEAHAVLGRVFLHFDWNAEEGERAMRRAFDLDPTDPFVLHCYSRVLADDGRFDEALRLADRALAEEPTSVLANRDKAVIQLLAGRYEEAIELARKTLELDPYSPFAHTTLGRAYEQLGRTDQAIEAYLTPLTFSEQHRDMVEALRAAARRGGLRGFWTERLRYLMKEPVVPLHAVAVAHVRIGDHDRALEWLEKLYAARGGQLRTVKVMPEWAPLRGDPRFQDVLRRANLTPMTSAMPARTASALATSAH